MYISHKKSAYRRDFDKLIKDNELLEKCNKIWEKVKNSLEREFDSELLYNEKWKISKS